MLPHRRLARLSLRTFFAAIEDTFIDSRASTLGLGNSGLRDVSGGQDGTIMPLPEKCDVEDTYRKQEVDEGRASQVLMEAGAQQHAQLAQSQDEDSSGLGILVALGSQSEEDVDHDPKKQKRLDEAIV